MRFLSIIWIIVFTILSVVFFLKIFPFLFICLILLSIGVLLISFVIDLIIILIQMYLKKPIRFYTVRPVWISINIFLSAMCRITKTLFSSVYIFGKDTKDTIQHAEDKKQEFKQRNEEKKFEQLEIKTENIIDAVERAIELKLSGDIVGFKNSIISAKIRHGDNDVNRILREYFS